MRTTRLVTVIRALTRLTVVSAVVAACNTAGPTVAPPTGAPTEPAPAATPIASPSPAAYAPPARTSAAMAWDPASGRILLFGGDTSSGATNAFDAWDGERWTDLGRLGPPSRDDGRLVADPARGVVTLSGGRNGQRILNDTWEWDGARWTQKTNAGPTPRAHAASAFDPVSKRVIVYGGVSETDTLRDTWAWDGTAWTQLESAGIPGRIPNGMAWDAVRQQLLVLAVDLQHPAGDQVYPSELWGWTGDAWELVADGGPAFSPLQQFVAGPEHPFLIDGGVVQGSFRTYEWSGTGWTELDGAAPPVRNGQAAAYDPVRGQLVMFGGFVANTVFGDTWTFEPEAGWRPADEEVP